MHNPSDRLVSIRGPRHKQRPGKFFRRFRRTVRAVFITLILLPVLAVVLTQGPVAQWLLARAVRNATGADFQSSWVSLKLDGRLVISDVRLQARGVKGQAGDIVDAREVEVFLDWSAWAAGVVSARSVRIDKPTLRVSLSSDTSTLNLSALGRGAADPGALPMLPRVEVVGGTVILGEHHHDGAFNTLATFRARGWISPFFQSDRYLIQLRAENPADASMDFSVTGQMNITTSDGEVAVSGIDLSRWTRDKLPTAVGDLWENLRLRGRIAQTAVRYTRAAGIEATLQLQDVALRAPFASGRAEITGSRNPLMENVTGYLRFTTSGPGQGLQAELAGLFEDLPARVRFESGGLTLDAPYRAVVMADRFLLEKDPRILWFTPEVVQKNFERFSGPTAVIDARIELLRAPPESPDVPGETSISGTMIFRNANAAYEIFPYPLHDLSGTIRFDDDKVEIVGVQGRGPTGARVFAEGLLEPPSGGSSLQVEVAATDLPMDQYLWDTLDKTQGKAIVDAVFSRQRLQELRDKGLIAPEGSPGDAAAPPFAFGGFIDSLVVRVYSPFGPGQPLHQAIDVRFYETTILPDVFPYPLKGRNVAVRIGNDYCEVIGNEFTGLRGGAASLNARVDFKKAGPDQKSIYEPTIHVTTQHFPVDPLLINAIPEQQRAAPEEPGQLSVRGLLTELNVAGFIDGTIDLTPNRTPDAAPGATSLTARLALDLLSARPAHPAGAAGAPVALAEVSGGLHITDDSIAISALSGKLVPARPAPDAPAGPASTFLLDGRWNASTTIPAPALALNLSAILTDLDVNLALEDVLRPLSPDAADTLADFRDQHLPTGVVDMTIAVTQPRGGGMDLDASFTNGRNLAAEMQGHHIQANQRSGLIRATATLGGAETDREPLRLTFNDFVADLALDGRPTASITVNGSVSPAQADPPRPLAVYEPVNAQVRGLHLENPFAREVMGKFGGPALERQLIELNPEGIVDGELRLTTKPGVNDPTEWDLWAAIRPEWLAFNKGAGGPRIVFPLVSGQVTVEGNRGVIQELTVLDEAGGWNARFNGQWIGARDASSDGPARPWTVQATAALEADGFTPNVLALLPGAVSRVITDSHAQVYGGLEAPDIAIVLTGAPPTRAADEAASPPFGYGVTGTLSLHALYAQPGGGGNGESGGISVRNGEIIVAIDAHKPPDGPGLINLGIQAPRVRIAGLKVTDGAGTITIADAPGGGAIVTMPGLTGRAYGGRVAISGVAAAPPAEPGSVEAGSGGPTTYQAAVKVAGVRFADILADQQRQHTAAVGPPLPEDFRRPEPDAPRADYTRGMVEAEVSLSGTMGAHATRQGRGAVRIAGGKAVVNMPVIFELLQLSNLQLPTGEQFDFAHAGFYINNDTLTFESAVLLSDPLALVGSGSMNLASGGLDLRFISRSRTRLPMVSDLIETIRNGVISTRVGGTVTDPAYQVEPLLSIRRLLAGRPSELDAAARLDLSGLERDRQRALGLITEVQAP